ncbi:MAG: complex I subunit 4 family protein [Polyangiaceae bacterium]
MRLRTFVFFFLALGILLVAHRSARADAAAHGKIVLSGNGTGLLVLMPQEGVFRGEMTITNAGDDALLVSRVAPRGDENDVRSPPKLTAKFTEGDATSASIAPHASKKVAVVWAPAHETSMKQLWGQIVVTSTDDAAGEVAMGVHAQVPSSVPIVQDHLLSWILFLPILGAVLMLLMHLARVGDDALAQKIALGVSGGSAALSFWLFRAFDSGITRGDGNDGFQFIERASWIRSLHVEYFVGVDGLSVAMILVASVVSFVGIVASIGAGERKTAYFAGFLLLSASITGMFVALDLVLFFAFWCAFFAAAYRLLASRGPAAEIAASKLGLVGLVSSALLLVAISGLYQHSERTFAVDGTAVAHSFAIPELMHVSYNDPAATLLGFSLVKTLWVTLFVPFMLLAAVAPLHTWLVDTVSESSGALGAMLGAVGVEVGVYGMMRLCFGVLPEATRWAAGAIVGLGAASVIYGALCAFAQKDLKKFVAYATVSHAGVALLGIGSLTPEGIAGACIEMCAHAVAGSVLFLAVAAVEERAHTRRFDELAGVAKQMPMLGGALVLSLAASFGVPGLVGFWGECLATIGAFPAHRLAATIAAFGFALVAAAHVRILDTVGFGKLDESWQKSPYLEPFGGKFPDVTTRELVAIGPLVILVVLLGVWPAPVLSTVSSAVRDTAALVNPPGPDQVAARESRHDSVLALR